jgi:hypothetical protein
MEAGVHSFSETSCRREKEYWQRVEKAMVAAAKSGISSSDDGRSSLRAVLFQLLRARNGRGERRPTASRILIERQVFTQTSHGQDVVVLPRWSSRTPVSSHAQWRSFLSIFWIPHTDFHIMSKIAQNCQC